MSLVALINDGKWNAFEEAWTELILQEGPIDEACGALRIAANKKSVPRCIPLVKDHAEMLTGVGRHAEAARLLGNAMLLGGNPGELAKPLFAAAEGAYGGESWWESFAELSGLHANAADMRDAWSSFDRLLSMKPGVALFHAKGWGLGEIVELIPDEREVEVRFVSGRRDRFPMKTVLDIFEILPEDDLRSLRVRDPEALARMLREEPLEVLKNAVQRFHGRAAYPVIKGALSQLGIDGSSFSGWWRKARKAAEASEWFEVSGTGVKAQVQLLVTAADPAEGLRRQLRMARSLSIALNRVRDLLSGSHNVEDSVKAAALETLEELAAAKDHPIQTRLSAWIFLRDQLGRTPEPLAERVQAAVAEPEPADPSKPPALFALFKKFPTARDQERGIQLMREAFSEAELVDRATRHLQHLPPGMVRGIVEELVAAGRTDELARHYSSLLARPMRNPAVLVALAERAERGDLSGDFPAPEHRLQSFMRLAVHLEAGRLRDPAIQRTRDRLTVLLCNGSPTLMRRLLADADAAFLRSTLNIVARGVDEALDNELTMVVSDMAPELFREGEKPFWETGIWTTRAGLSRREEELRQLVEEKIPANSEAIGKAAAYGDLSENSEWEAAMEEQRNLTARAAEIEAEVRSAQLIENAIAQEDTAAPGTAVRYRELASGREQHVTILGPWDTGGDDVISYRAPVAAGLLGRRAGERAVLHLPSGELEVEVLEVVPVPLV